MDVIGMTNLQEAKLAREAEICYATIALVTDYDCWHPDHDSVTVDMIVATLMQNVRRRSGSSGRGASAERTCGGSALSRAIHEASVRPRRKRFGIIMRTRGSCDIVRIVRLRLGTLSCRPRVPIRSRLRRVRDPDIIVTGSIAFDYLMSFPGKFTEHLLPEHVERVSLSFLVDTMDKRRGGCGPNIAYTLALLGERPRLMGTAGQDFGEYRQWLDAAGVDTSLVAQVPGKFTASFFCSTDAGNNQIASFYTGAMANAGELSFRDAGGFELAVISPNDPGAMPSTPKSAGP